MAALPEVLEEVSVPERFGNGLPFAFGVVGFGLFVAAAPGVATFGAQNGYAKLGIVIVVLVATASLLVAGYLLRDLDPTAWKLTRDRDGPRAQQEADEQ